MQGRLRLEKSPPKACLSLLLALPGLTMKASLLAHAPHSRPARGSRQWCAAACLITGPGLGQTSFPAFNNFHRVDPPLP